MRYAMSPEKFRALFGERDRSAGVSRLCKTCGGWHEAGKTPHNCRPPVYVRQHLAAPQIAPPFGEAFRAGVTPGNDDIIGDRRARREYMKRRDLVEYEPTMPAVPEETWVDRRREEEQWSQDFKAVCEMDPLERMKYAPTPISDDAGDGAGEIDVAQVPIIKETPTP